MDGDVVGDRLLLHEEPEALEPLDHRGARRVAVQAGQRPGRRRHVPLRIDGRQHLKAVTLADLEVGRVVARRHLQRTGPEVLVDGLVADELDLPLCDGHEHLAADERLPPRVVRMHRDGGVRHDGLGPRRGDHQIGRPVRHRRRPGVAHIRELVGALDVQRLQIRVRGQPSMRSCL